MDEFVPATLDHAKTVAAKARGADVDELWACAKYTPLGCLELGLEISPESWAWLWDGEPVCVFGVSAASVLVSSGAPWMVGTEEIDKHPFRFLRHGRDVIQHMLRQYEILENYVDARNRMAVKWLKWLGFTIHPPEPYGVFGMPFHKFTLKRGA